MAIISLSQGYNKQVVDILEQYLQMAKQGQISEVILVYKQGAQYSHDWSGCDNLIELIGWIECIKQKQIERAQGLIA